jgi:hypothetical protein
MNKFIIIGIIIAIIIGIILLTSAFLGNIVKEGIGSTESQEGLNENKSEPQGRNLSIEFDEKMGFEAP